MDTEASRPANVLPVPRWTILIHGAQVLLAIIILGLSAYGVRWVAYNALIYSLVVCICTLGVAAYIIASSLFLHKLYNAYIVLAFHIWMIIFWIVDLGLVANLARIWSTYDDLYWSVYSYGYYTYPYAKRDLSHLAKRDTTTYKAYYGALAAGAFFAAVQFVLWVVGAVIVGIYLNKNRSNPNATHTAPPAYANNGPAVQTEPKQQYQQQSYSAAPTPQPQYAQPAHPQQPQQSYSGQQPYAAPYPSDPINRGATVSPVSQAYTGPSSELASPQHTGGYNANANELPVSKQN